MHSSRTTLDEKKFNLYKNISGKNFKGNLGLNLRIFSVDEGDAKAKKNYKF